MTSQSQQSVSEFDRIYTLNNIMLLLNIDYLPVPQKPYTAYSHTMKKQRLKYIKQTFLTLLELMFPVESCEIYEKLAKEELASQYTPKDTSCDSILDGLVTPYNKTETWNAKRQVLSVLASILSYTETSELIPGITQYRYYMAQKHALYYGAALPVEPRMDLEKLDNFMDFIHVTFPHIVKRSSIWGEENQALNRRNCQHTKCDSINGTSCHNIPVQIALCRTEFFSSR